jgi:hypothetical protein
MDTDLVLPALDGHGNEQKYVTSKRARLVVGSFPRESGGVEGLV